MKDIFILVKENAEPHFFWLDIFLLPCIILHGDFIY